MSRLGRLGLLLALPRERRSMLWAGGRAVLRAAWQVRVWPFRRLAAGLGAPLPPSALVPDTGLPTDARGQALAREVRWAVAAWTRSLPRPPSCLMRALAARQMLVAHGVPCDLFFGVQSQAGADAPRGHAIGAHAWLRCGDLIVTGELEAAAFRPIAVYRFDPAHARAAAP